ncbi:hypothetical protein KEJ34_07675 [Candidatus Bathyarchaeota archaeon]|nr:hypothetical protein [Candidatus Bathyarchaeota archaeon]
MNSALKLRAIEAGRNKGNPEKYNENLKAHFQFEIKKERDGLIAVVYSVDPIPHLKVFGNFGNFEISKTLGKDIAEEQKETEGDVPPPEAFENSKIPKIRKDEGESIDIHRCSECKHWKAGKCLLRLDWVVVMPTHPACERFEPREEAQQI